MLLVGRIGRSGDALLLVLAFVFVPHGLGKSADGSSGSFEGSCLSHRRQPITVEMGAQPAADQHGSDTSEDKADPVGQVVDDVALDEAPEFTKGALATLELTLVGAVGPNVVDGPSTQECRHGNDDGEHQRPDTPEQDRK